MIYQKVFINLKNEKEKERNKLSKITTFSQFCGKFFTAQYLSIEKRENINKRGKFLLNSCI